MWARHENKEKYLHHRLLINFLLASFLAGARVGLPSHDFTVSGSNLPTVLADLQARGE